MSEKSRIFNRNSKCIFKGGQCDETCDDQSVYEGDNQSSENLITLERCLGMEKENRFFDWKRIFI